jgi:hypothetical protein
MGVAGWLLWLDPSGTLSAGFPPPAVPLLDAGRFPPHTTTQVWLFKQLLDKRTGALLVISRNIWVISVIPSPFNHVAESVWLVTE